MENQATSDAQFEVAVEKILPLARTSAFMDIVRSESFSPAACFHEGALSAQPAWSIPHLQLNIISNARSSRARWKKLSNIHDMVNAVRISVDAASKDTFETLRLGGHWPALLKNLVHRRAAALA